LRGQARVEGDEWELGREEECRKVEWGTKDGVEGVGEEKLIEGLGS